MSVSMFPRARYLYNYRRMHSKDPRRTDGEIPNHIFAAARGHYKGECFQWKTRMCWHYQNKVCKT